MGCGHAWLLINVNASGGGPKETKETRPVLHGAAGPEDQAQATPAAATRLPAPMALPMPAAFAGLRLPQGLLC